MKYFTDNIIKSRLGCQGENTGKIADFKPLSKLRRHADGHGDRRKFLGAVAGAVTVEIPEGFKPREW
ncbi:MAG: hypothetical protein LBL70_04615 [Treponema sp.]|nr:hypothetical protein [Treponema sp.]